MPTERAAKVRGRGISSLSARRLRRSGSIFRPFLGGLWLAPFGALLGHGLAFVGLTLFEPTPLLSPTRTNITTGLLRAGPAGRTFSMVIPIRRDVSLTGSTSRLISRLHVL